MFLNTIVSILPAFLVLLSSQDTMGQSINQIMEQNLTTPGPDIKVNVLELIFPPGDAGAPPHYHSGPVVGYVAQGEFLFQVKGGPVKIIRAGGAFHEKDRDVHIWGGNASNSTWCKVIATVYGRPDEPILTFVEDKNLRGSYEEAVASAEIQEKRFTVLNG